MSKIHIISVQNTCVSIKQKQKRKTHKRRTWIRPSQVVLVHTEYINFTSDVSTSDVSGIRRQIYVCLVHLAPEYPYFNEFTVQVWLCWF